MSQANPGGDSTGATAARTGDGSGDLQRNLSNRHIQLIAIGGAIGTGLFMGSGKTIHLAGPSILIVYLIIGTVLLFVMRAMGEMLLFNLNYKSFQDFAGDLIGPFAGYVTGWTYWFLWIVTGMAEIIAVAGYFDFWLHDKNMAMLCAGGMLLVLLGLNLMTVALFGEMEFWFALIKIVAILGLILVGVYLIVTGFTSPAGTRSSLTHLWDHGGFFPNGIGGFMAAFQIAIFAFVGIELVGTTAAETKDPETTLPRAINSIPVRIVFFYVFSLVAIMSVTPWNEVDPEVSPFVNMFNLAGLVGAAGLMNFVVLTSASSSCNSGIFSTSRMLFGLADKCEAPAGFHKLSRHKVPANALIFSVALIFMAFPILIVGDSIIEAFTLVTTVASILVIVIWAIILLSYMRYLKLHPEAHAQSHFKMPGAKFMPIVCLAFFALVIVLLTLEADTRTALMYTPLWFVLLLATWPRVRKGRHNATGGAHSSATAEPAGTDGR
ncbi:amino acid permease [Gephyromycinifex aptenodytis]|uniref:amino acid permease n=1 Tax=Gephyromycinifex aptenodytis TaxID=2716227 RepID=UPI001446B9F3|nr:amino acid permease [Gephyromycinifex aptenodytis]